jgi:hypothetical protein
LNRAARRKIIEPVISIILFFITMIAQVVSLTREGVSKGFRKRFHWLL